MKIRVTLSTENNVPVSSLGDNPEEKVRAAWELICNMMNDLSDRDTMSLDKIEILGDFKEAEGD